MIYSHSHRNSLLSQPHSGQQLQLVSSHSESSHHEHTYLIFRFVPKTNFLPGFSNPIFSPQQIGKG